MCHPEQCLRMPGTRQSVKQGKDADAAFPEAQQSLESEAALSRRNTA